MDVVQITDAGRLRFESVLFDTRGTKYMRRTRREDGLNVVIRQSECVSDERYPHYEDANEKDFEWLHSSLN